MKVNNDKFNEWLEKEKELGLENIELVDKDWVIDLMIEFLSDTDNRGLSNTDLFTALKSVIESIKE